MIVDLNPKDIQLPTRMLKEHPEGQIEQIVKSIQAYGFNDPVAVDERNEVIEGVGRVLAARKLNLESIPVIQLKHLNETQKRAYRIAHNKITLNTGFDLDALKTEFESLLKLDSTLFTGFETIELDDLLTMPELSELGPELTESLKDSKTVTCPQCGERIYV